jgi:hypothetical protein
MRRQGSGGAKGKTAYQVWKEQGQPRPYLGEVIAKESFDFFSLASLLLAIGILGWWFRSIYTVAFPSPREQRVPVAYSGGGASLFSQATPTPTPTPAVAHGGGVAVDGRGRGVDGGGFSGGLYDFGEI